MLAAAALLLDAVARAPSPEDHRIGVYVLAAIVGLITSGLISCAKEARKARAGL
jgi:hypothetical protein